MAPNRSGFGPGGGGRCQIPVYKGSNRTVCQALPRPRQAPPHSPFLPIAPNLAARRPSLSRNHVPLQDFNSVRSHPKRFTSWQIFGPRVAANYNAVEKLTAQKGRRT
jgi:hypothetical protein